MVNSLSAFVWLDGVDLLFDVPHLGGKGNLPSSVIHIVHQQSLDFKGCELVTLSGSETGLAQNGGGDEQLGLGSAFLVAGTKSLVMNLWSVEAFAAFELIQIFYQNLLAGESKAQALRNAQCNFLHRTTTFYAHPYFWAAFCLVGDIGAIKFTRKETSETATSERSPLWNPGSFRLSLSAFARVKCEDDKSAFVGKAYSVQVGVTQNKPEFPERGSGNLPLSNPDEQIVFDISLYTSNNIELTSEWQQNLCYYLNSPEPQLVEFTFRIIAAGSSSLGIDFYHNLHWLRTVHLEFEAREQSHNTLVSSEVMDDDS